MAGSRTLKLSILADVDDLRRKLNTADNEVQGFGDKIGKWSKVAGAAFLAAGAAAAAYAGKLAIDGVKAAVEDEAAQLKLATTLKNVTGATQAQTKAVEDYILKTELAYGVTDDQLRPSLDRLVRSTKDVSEAQKLQNLALNISAGTGKDLESVTNALAKAYDGNLGALKKVGITLDDSIIKSKNFDAAAAALARTFKDQASLQAETFDGKMRRLSVAFNEGKETIGGFILDAIQPMVDIVIRNVIPALQAFSDGIGGGRGLKAAFTEYIDFAKKIFMPVIEGFKNAFDNIKNAVMDNKDEFQALFNFLKNFVAPLLGGALKLAIEAIGVAISVLVKAIGGLISAFETVYNAAKKFVDFLKNNPITKFFTGSSGTSKASFDNASFDTSNMTFTNADYSTGGTGGGGGTSGGGSSGGGTSGGGGSTPTRANEITIRGRTVLIPYGLSDDQAYAYAERVVANAEKKDELKAETARIKEKIAARARGEIFGTGNVTNITVNGAIDPESTARQLNDILTQSAARGGGAYGLTSLV